MTDIALPALSIALNYFGLSFLALSQNRHWRAVTATSGSLASGQKYALRTLGYGLLISVLAVLILDAGLNFGVLSWVMFQAPLAMVVSFTLTWRPQLLRPVSKFMLLLPLALSERKQYVNLNQRRN